MSNFRHVRTLAGRLVYYRKQKAGHNKQHPKKVLPIAAGQSYEYYISLRHHSFASLPFDSFAYEYICLYFIIAHNICQSPCGLFFLIYNEFSGGVVLFLALQEKNQKKRRTPGVRSVTVDTCFSSLHKKAGCARCPQLAYRGFPCRQARQNGEVDFAQFPIG